MNEGSVRILRPLLLSLTLSFAAIFVVMRVSVSHETVEALRGMDRRLFVYCVALVATAWTCNGLRLRLLTGALGHRIPLRRCVRITLSSEFGIAATPSGVGGGLLRIYLLRGQGVRVGEAMSMLAADMAIDMLFMLSILPLALGSFLQIFRPLLQKPGEAVPMMLLGMAAFVLVAGLLWYRWMAANSGSAGGSKRTAAASTGVQGFVIHARRMLGQWTAEFRSGLSTLLRLRRATLAAAFLVSIVQWSCRYGILVVILRGLGYGVNPFALFLLQGLLCFGGLLLVIPGGGGGVEIAFATTVSQLVPAGIVGVALILWRFFTYYLYLIGGGAMVLLTAGKGGFSGSFQAVSEDLPPAG